MPEYKSPSFEKSNIEITQALSTLKRHGINVQLPKDLVKQLDAITLFGGDDGLFKELIKLAEIYFEYGCGNQQSLFLSIRVPPYTQLILLLIGCVKFNL